ncbi:uncharacterized protein NP_7026A (plasmid) [Natronomonas pharaonis DSM 2160]|uniref:Uncharacterized protein n=1 Tax=Natronomonas pharaonis (strain ATCC 35678 / DSM 2160 / CIP 103997 / JCM 8858 / NBRC 14720 / NCIMB 2260 / Gabara) TaxID=348780 RepID=Q3ILU1_NATPD|nr:hypothetical protein [Natronomonas pharaonis]CAI49742.1 uncharacterized protein NP_3302A [Natronomonas pharaonis DSM 2160]CAI50929.1 uncharacterized protein NP_7026A [Natronomonas pharaonis DSM 2160]
MTDDDLPGDDVLDDDLLEDAETEDTDPKTRGKKAGERMRQKTENFVLWTGGVAGGLTSTAFRIVPFTGRLFKRMAVKSIENYHKKAGGDAVGIVAKEGQQIDLIPVKYRTPEEVDEGEKAGWKAKGIDKVWNPGPEGYSVNYIGRTPTVPLQRDDHVEAGWLKPRIGTAIELDNYWPLFVNPDITANIDYGAAGGSQRARADGGINDPAVSFELDSPGEWAGDNIIDLDSGDGYDGMRISFNKAKEWRAETTTSESMQMQEDRGFLRGRLSGDEGPSLFKLLLLCAAIILGVLAIVLIGPQLVGGEDGGSSMNPLLVNSLMAFGAV